MADERDDDQRDGHIVPDAFDGDGAVASAVSGEDGEGFSMRRRTLIAGAAWTIPAVVLASASPAFAAASGLTLAFDKSSYSGVGCSTISGAKVTASNNGVLKSSVTVTVTLSGGYTFPGGATSYSGSTGADGTLVLPDIAVPLAGGSAASSANATGASSSATLAGSPASTAGYVQDDNYYSATSVPANSKPLFDNWYLGADGNIYNSVGSIVVGNVASVGDYDGNVVPLIMADGSAAIYRLADSMFYPVPAVPKNSRAVYGNAFLAPNGSMYNSDGTVLVGNVANFGQSDGTQIPLRMSDGTNGVYRLSDATYWPATSVPAGSSPMYGSWFLGSNANIYSASGAVIASGVADFGWASGSPKLLPVRKSSGEDGYFDMSNSGAYSLTRGGVPVSSTPIYGNAFLSRDNGLYNSDGTLLVGNVSSVGAYDGNVLPLIMTDGSAALYRLSSATFWAAPSVPANSTPVYGNAFLGADHSLYNSDGTVLVGNVTSVGAYDGNVFPLLMTNGSAGLYKLSSATFWAAPSVPANSRPIYGNAFLTPSGVVCNSDGTQLVGNVAAVGAYDGNVLPLAMTDGSAGLYRLSNATFWAAPSVPANAKPVYGNAFLAPNSGLYNSDGTLLVGGVSTWGAYDGNVLPVVMTDGSAGLYRISSANFYPVPVPARDARPVSGAYFITDSRDLIDGSAGKLVRNAVVLVGKIETSDNRLPVGVMKTSC